MQVEKLPAEITIDGEQAYLRIKKTGINGDNWRIRYLSINPNFLSNKPPNMPNFTYRRRHDRYLVKLRSQGATLEEAAENMIENLTTNKIKI